MEINMVSVCVCKGSDRKWSETRLRTCQKRQALVGKGTQSSEGRTLGGLCGNGPQGCGGKPRGQDGGLLTWRWWRQMAQEWGVRWCRQKQVLRQWHDRRGASRTREREEEEEDEKRGI